MDAHEPAAFGITLNPENLVLGRSFALPPKRGGGFQGRQLAHRRLTVVDQNRRALAFGREVEADRGGSAHAAD